ncbi:M48 family metallopeptidase [uncultured Helicobacter sp.]|uniref:M48 family metallopeptidase n=1 Tax=uncultured Helicobacter sp. TaxID=175537 RepID=UPI0037538085
MQIKITKGTKRVNLRLKDAHTLLLSVPSYYTQSDCEQVLARHSAWIERTSAALHERERTRAQELESKRGEILYFGEWVSEEWVRQQLHTRGFSDRYGELEVFVKQHCALWAQKMGVCYESVSLSNARSFFGICTHDNHLRFARLLCFAPKDCIEYVIIHELAHIRHKNHSQAFWAFVGEFCEHFRQSRAFLRTNAWLYKALFSQCPPARTARTHRAKRAPKPL